MDEIWIALRSPAWWFTGVIVASVVGYVINIATHLSTPRVQRWLDNRAARRRSKNAAARARFEGFVTHLRTSREMRARCSAHVTELMLVSVSVFIVGLIVLVYSSVGPLHYVALPLMSLGFACCGIAFFGLHRASRYKEALRAAGYTKDSEAEWLPNVDVGGKDDRGQRDF